MTSDNRPQEVLEGLYRDVGEWATKLLVDHDPGPIVRDTKVVRDAVHGFHTLWPHEIAFIDSPFFQRLRYIHQNGLAHLVYPTMRHSRFDHSLGMAYVAEQMIATLMVKYPDIDPIHRQLVRLAALMHDLGHTIFSHAGENIIDNLFGDDIDMLKRAVIRGVPNFFETASSGEILSYVIATCDPVKGFLIDQFSKYRGRSTQQCLLREDEIYKAAGLIVGRVGEQEQYLADIINGSLDADKLEYIPRDCHFSGIRAEVDIQRIIHGLAWVETAGYPRTLTVSASVVPQLEQLLMSKMLLYSSIYHHHKVRTLEAMIKDVFQQIADQQDDIKHEELKARRMVDFLSLSEPQFFVWGQEETVISSSVNAILNRRLLKRCLVINRHTVTEQSQTRITAIISAMSDVALLEARKEIFERIPGSAQTRVGELWLDIPKGPDVHKEAMECMIDHGSGTIKRLADSFPYSQWMQTYEANKLTYHLFYVPAIDKRVAAAEAAEGYLNDRFRITFTPQARAFAHID